MLIYLCRLVNKIFLINYKNIWKIKKIFILGKTKLFEMLLLRFCCAAKISICLDFWAWSCQRNGPLTEFEFWPVKIEDGDEENEDVVRAWSFTLFKDDDDDKDDDEGE